MKEEDKKKAFVVPTHPCYRLGANGGNICGLINRGRNGGDQHGAARGLTETEEFIGEGSAVGSGSFPENWQCCACFFMCDIKH